MPTTPNAEEIGGVVVWGALSVPFFGVLWYFAKKSDTWAIKPRYEKKLPQQAINTQ